MLVLSCACSFARRPEPAAASDICFAAVRSLAHWASGRSLSIRGPEHSVHVALALGCDVVKGPAHRLIARLAPDILIVDDPSARDAAEWIAAARQAGVAVASIHDLGIGCLDADLLIDGSVTPGRTRRRRGAATGPAYAILDPNLPRPRAMSARPRRVVVSLGGGPRAEVACAIAGEIGRRAPDVEVRVVGGFVSGAPPRSVWRRCPPNVVWKGPSTHLAGRARATPTSRWSAAACRCTKRARSVRRPWVFRSSRRSGRRLPDSSVAAPRWDARGRRSAPAPSRTMCCCSCGARAFAGKWHGAAGGSSTDRAPGARPAPSAVCSKTPAS